MSAEIIIAICAGVVAVTVLGFIVYALLRSDDHDDSCWG